MQAWGNMVPRESASFYGLFFFHFPTTSVQNDVPLSVWWTWSRGEGWTWTGRLNKKQQWFLLSRLLQLNPHTPWHGAPLLVERPVSMHKVDLADCELKLRPCCDIIPFSLSVSAPPYGSQACWTGGRQKERRLAVSRWKKKKGLFFFRVLEDFSKCVFLNINPSWAFLELSVPLFAFHTCEQWLLVAARLAQPSRLAPSVHHCGGKVVV